MTNNPVTPDKPHVYAFSTSRLVLLASMLVLLVALSMMLGIRIERQQRVQLTSNRQAIAPAVKKKVAPPSAEPAKPNVAQPKPADVTAPQQNEEVAKTPTTPEAQTEPSNDQPARGDTDSTKTGQDATIKKSEVIKTTGEVEKPEVVKPTVTVEVKEPVAPPLQKTLPQGHYAIQVQSSQDKNKASLQVELLKKKGLKAYIEEADLKDKGTYYRVLIGPFQTKAKAEEIRTILKKDSRFTGSFIKYIP